MNKIVKLFVTTIAAASLVLTGCSTQKTEPASSKEETKLKVGFIYVGPIGDGGYTYAHDQGRLYLENELKGKVETIYKESVKEDKAEVQKVVEDMIEQGAKVIVGTSFGFQEGLLAAANEHKDIKFLHCSGYEMADNMGQYFGKIHEMMYLNGIVAGLKTKTNTLGFVGAFPIPEVIRNINAFTLGAKSVNPNIKVKVTWTNTWYDPAKEKDAALALIDSGADVIAQHQDTAGPQQAAEAKGVFSIGYNTDMSKTAPKANLTSAVWNWGPYYVKQVKAIMDGTWKSEKYWGSYADGVVDQAPLTSLVPEEAKNAVEKAKADIKDGKLKIFTGEIKDQKGNVKVEKGNTLSDDEVWNMNWFVEGVDGTIPAN
ncbi:BMP family ABC transporter substrate-binding protein [Clostridium sp. SYSU_GA19001]|uniref:BMP family ABC transporter substrate-binding protein n=1 Tax=Clostridium caldaquaticum TaxID=2940653 RepID=UPI0020776E85|nr:BMP family ABC transporter substrate-binding protein [Clostridium caldaquaticum]MCM8711803.1 BMP family ABC transporter substrate-binding protein [Clostridium caldaquaticum]